MDSLNKFAMPGFNHQKLLSILTFVLFLPVFSLLTQVVAADEAHYNSYNVTVDVNPDSTYTVTEDVAVYFEGTYRYVFRGLTLSDSNAQLKCSQATDLQCGGFDYVEFLGFYNESGSIVPQDQIKIENVNESGEDRLKLTWTFAPEGRSFNGEEFKYTIKYKVYGGLGFFSDYALFYWDMLPPERPTVIPSSNIVINMPPGFSFNEEDLKVLGNTPYSFADMQYELSSNATSVLLKINNIRISENVTVALKFPLDLVSRPASLKLNTEPDPIDIKVNGVQIEEVSGTLGGIPAGKSSLEFSQSGYLSSSMEVELAAGETKEVTVTLEKDPLQMILQVLLLLCSLCSCLLLPLALVLIYYQWYSKGRDPKYRDTIIPQYQPPVHISPYLLGSIKDEQVDMVDITATIIDAATKGYIKIVEFDTGSFLGIGGSKDYELLKLKDFSSLKENEKKIMEAVFDYKERVVVSQDLKFKFHTKVPALQNAINDEMVSKGYFKESPQAVKNKYLGIGIGLMSISFFGIATAAVILIFIPPVFILVIDLLIIGIVLAIISRYMPAKTLAGAKILNEILGFRMYLHTAERFRVQDLTPETFEKFLPYAMVFGIEKEWAARFKDIYTKAPDWYESSSLSTFNTIYLLDSLSRFNTTTAQALATTPQSSSSGRGFSGGGWSGGGGFGGSFGGGGGGGGSSGWG